MTSLISELKRRNVLKVAAAYALVAWILIEAGSVLLPTFGAPESFFKGYVLIVAAGFLLSLVITWVYERTPEGIKLEKDVDRTGPANKSAGRKSTYAIIGLLAVALGVSVMLNVTGMRDSSQRSSGGFSASSIAVLPFTSLSTDSSNVLFADGMHDDLLTSLASIKSLKVISRTSVLAYRDTTKNLRDIASELGVDTILEGTVQRVGDNVRINVQLIDAASDEHIWADRYDRALTAKNIFAIQSQISEEIAGALRTQLTAEEKNQIDEVRTENLKALELYRAGRNNIEKRRLETLRLAQEQFSQAIELDPEYSEAFSGLADSLMLLTINHNAIPADEARQQAQAALDKALWLDPMNADAYASLGLLKLNSWQQNRSGPEYDEAEAAFKRAIELRPNHASAYSWYASLAESKQDLVRAIELFSKSLELDPVARVPRSNLAGAYAWQGDHERALDEYLKGVRFNPDYPAIYDNIGQHLASLGRLDEAFAWSEKARELSTDPLAGQGAFSTMLAFGDQERAAQRLENIPPAHPFARIAVGYQEFFRGNIAEALASWESSINTSKSVLPFMLDAMSDAAALLGDYETSLEYCLQLNPKFNETPLIVDRANVNNAIKFAFLLQKTGEPQRADTVIALIWPVLSSMPRLGGAGLGIQDVQVLALQGKRDEALVRLRAAVDEGFRSARVFDNWRLEDDPYLESIRDTDGFRAIQADLATAIDVMKTRLQNAEASGQLASLREIALAR